VLLNLLSNSMKFTPAGGSVALSVSSRRVNVIESISVEPTSGELTTTRTLVDDSAAGKWDEVHVTVRDTGPGVGRQMLDRLFQPFTQGDGSFSRKAGGTGLGLAISKQLVNLLGGRIWLDAAVAEGSSFHFTIVCQNVAAMMMTTTPATTTPATVTMASALAADPHSPRSPMPPASLIARRRPSLGLPLPPQMGAVVIDASGDVSPTTSSTFAAVPTVQSSPRENGGAAAQLVKSSSVELHRRKAEEKSAAASNEPKRPLILGNYSAKRTRTRTTAHIHDRAC
jgi:hypothetical protein